MIQGSTPPNPFLPLAVLVAGLLLGSLSVPAAGQTPGKPRPSPPAHAKRHSGAEAPPDTLVRPKSSFGTVAAEVALSSVLAAAAGYGVGLLAEELFCEDCDASEPGGDVPGLVIGVPAGATLGVWLVGRRDPPPGRLADTVFGALVGAAVFAGFAEFLDGQPDAVRWSGVVLTGAFATMGWNRSRPRIPPGSRPREPHSLLVPAVSAHGEIGLAFRF